MSRRFMLTGEDGSILAVTLAMLVLLTLLGIAATTISESELLIAGNEKASKKSFYLADGAALAGSQKLEDSTAPESLAWLHLLNDFVSKDLRSPTNWTDDNSTVAVDEGRYFAIDAGPAEGYSLVMGSDAVHQLRIYGRSKANRAESLVEIGYAKKF